VRPGQELRAWKRSEARREQFSWDQRMPRVAIISNPAIERDSRESIPVVRIFCGARLQCTEPASLVLPFRFELVQLAA